MVRELTKDDFEEVIGGSDTVIVDFWAPWCGPCRAFAPIFEQAAADHPDVVFAKVNTEEQQALGAAFQVRSIPTLMVVREKVIVFSQAGALPAAGLKQVIERVKALDMDAVRQQVAAREQAARA